VDARLPLRAILAIPWYALRSRRVRAWLLHTRFGREGVQVQKLAVSLGSNCVSPRGLFAAAFVGLAITGLIVALTGYDTSASFRPVRFIATASHTCDP
jgi:Na+/H+-translocating membrane pyrophosphatase